jgi:hypothetical protein
MFFGFPAKVYSPVERFLLTGEFLEATLDSATVSWW